MEHPFCCFKLAATTGDKIKRMTGYNFPFNSATLRKLFGSAHYKTERIQQELGFNPQYNLDTMLPLIINQANCFHTHTIPEDK